MALQLKTFRITDQSSEDEANAFLQGKKTHHWSASYADNGWNILMIYEPEKPRHTNHSNHDSHQHHNKKAEKPVEHIPDIPADLRPLYEAIRKWRNTRAREENIKPYMLFNNKQLEDIIKAKPSDADTLKNIVTDMKPEHFEKYSGELVGMLTS